MCVCDWLFMCLCMCVCEFSCVIVIVSVLDSGVPGAPTASRCPRFCTRLESWYSACERYTPAARGSRWRGRGRVEGGRPSPVPVVPDPAPSPCPPRSDANASSLACPGPGASPCPGPFPSPCPGAEVGVASTCTAAWTNRTMAAGIPSAIT